MIELTIHMNLVICQNKLRRSISSNTKITQKVREWDLTQLRTLLTVDSLNDDETRKRAIYKRRRNENMLLGAVFGGAIDAENGDDSIVDGVLLGAAFGAICTTSPEAPKAQVGLLFNDGSHLAVEVDKFEYTQLQTIAAANQDSENKVFAKSFVDRSLTANEVKSILNDRANNFFISRVIAALFVALLPQIILLVLDNESPGQTIPEIVTIMLYLVCAIGFAVIILRSCFSMKKHELFLRGNEEKQLYNFLQVR